MEPKRNIFDFVSQTLVVYGFTVLVINIFCLFVGEEAREFSTMFALGAQGLSVATSFQFLGLSVLVMVFRTLFFTDVLIKKMRIVTRTAGMLAAVITTTILFVACFGWFPVDNAKCWVMFLICFGISFVLSLAATLLKERMENRQMEEALEKIKGKE